MKAVCGEWIDSVVRELAGVGIKLYEVRDRDHQIASRREDHRRQGENGPGSRVDGVRDYGKAVLGGADWGNRKGSPFLGPANETLVASHGLRECEVTDLDCPKGLEIPCEWPAADAAEVEFDPLGIGTGRVDRFRKLQLFPVNDLRGLVQRHRFTEVRGEIGPIHRIGTANFSETHMRFLSGERCDPINRRHLDDDPFHRSPL